MMEEIFRISAEMAIGDNVDEEKLIMALWGSFQFVLRVHDIRIR